MIATYQQIADSLGISKQAVDKLFVKKGYLVKDNKGKIDIDNPENRYFLESKGADFSFFGTKTQPETQKVIQKPVEMPSKPAKIQQKTEESDGFVNKYQGSPQQKLDMKLKFESIKAKQLESELKKLKIQEQLGRLIDRSLCEKLINDSLGAIVQAFITLPSSVVDMIFTIYENHPTDRREQIIKLLQEKYTKESKKIIDRAFQKHRKAVKEQIEQAENEPES